MTVLLEQIQINKHKYCMAKDDIAVGLGRPMFGTSVHLSRKKAYPSVVTTIVHMVPVARKFMALNNFLCRKLQDRVPAHILWGSCSARE